MFRKKAPAPTPVAAPPAPMKSQASSPSISPFEHFGKCVFTGKVAAGYLEKQGLPGDTLESPSWVANHADAVAAAVVHWATDNGADTFCHWFQPLASSGVRHGQSGQVQNRMISFDRKTNKIKFDFDGNDLIRGETDGSSYPNGGLRATHTAGGYLAIDTSSPIFLRGDAIFIPAVFVSYFGAALDEKTPLLRANAALSKHGGRLLKLLGLENSGVVCNIGLEQELFLIPREAYYKRPDLQLTGRTVMGMNTARGQEMCDHYMAPLSSATPALGCMQEVQDQCYRIGIPLRTRHREVAPNQYECCPLFGVNTTQIDQNLMVMQILEEVAPKYGLSALMQEKPFNDINGSGKHNNWSMATKEGVMLLNPKSITKASGNPLAFAVVMAAVVAAVDDHGDLMRMAIASPGNDFRLGAMEAPPAIISTYLGEDVTVYLERFMNGEDVGEYTPGTKTIDLGIGEVVPFQVPAEDRNRTSPFPYGGNRFEFRAVGSSQNVSMVNTVLSTMCADKMKDFADQIDAGESIEDVARAALKKHWKVIFNGNGYAMENQAMLTERGVWRIDSGVEATKRLTAEKNIELFGKLGVLSEVECKAREHILHEHYAGTVEIEAGSMIDMIQQHVIPSCNAAGLTETVPLLEKAIETIKSEMHKIEEIESAYETAQLSRTLRLETMVEIRKLCDAAEKTIPSELWTLATYKDLLFLDPNLDHPAAY